MRKILFALALLAASLPVFGQTYALMPLPRFFAEDATGAPLVNGCLFTYAAGTTSPLTTYSDNQGTPNADPVVLDSLGTASIFIPTSEGFKVALYSPGNPANATCSNGSLLWTQDNIFAAVNLTLYSSAQPVSVSANTISFQTLGTYTVGGTIANVQNRSFHVISNGSLTTGSGATSLSLNLFINNDEIIGVGANSITVSGSTSYNWVENAECGVQVIGTSGTLVCQYHYSLTNGSSGTTTIYDRGTTATFNIAGGLTFQPAIAFGNNPGTSNVATQNLMEVIERN